MEDGVLIAAITVGILFMGALALLWLGFWGPKLFLRVPQLPELVAPLLDVTGHRLDAALRNADEGFSRCLICQFENFKRTKFCCLCGAKVDPVNEVEEPSDNIKHEEIESNETNSIVNKMRQRLQRVKVEGESQSSLQCAEGYQDNAWRSSRRCQRAMKRKEWTRVLDVEGRPRWYRDTCGNHAATQLPGFSVIFQAEGGSLGERDVEVVVAISTDVYQSAGNDTESQGDPDSPQPTVDALAKEKQQLLDETSGAKLTFINPTNANPCRLPIDMKGSEMLDLAQIKDVLLVADQSFPTKYAHFVTVASSLIADPSREYIRLNIDRSKMFDESLEALAVVPVSKVRSVLRINFLDEHGVDAGGLHREWFIMLTEMLADPARGLFVCIDKTEQTFHLNPNSQRDVGDKHLLYYYAIGRIIGRALLEGSVMALHLSPPLLKLMLGLPLSFADMEDFDPEMYRSMRWLLDNEDVDELGLDFTVTLEDGNERKVVELLPNGSSVAVTDVNKQQFVDLKWKHLIIGRVTSQLQALLKGFYEVVPPELILLLDASELDFLLCGSDDIDVDDWEKHTNHSEELHNHWARVWFWELVREMPNEYRRRLLLFATGSSRVPLAGFSALTSYDGKLCPFTLKAVPLVGDGFIHSHACFNRLDLPLHVVRKELHDVLYAVLDTELYGFTTD